MKILIVQNKVYKDIDETLKSINNLIFGELKKRPDLIMFPEMFTTPYELDYLKKYRQNNKSKIIDFLKRLAKENHCYVVGGSLPFIEKNNIYNSCFIIDKDGFEIERYDKIHLFEITYPNGDYFSESSVLSSGNKVITFKTEFGKFGIMICFDIRFPLLANRLMEQDVVAIFVPAAFNMFTGPTHWTTTFRARAIDNQLYMIGCSPSQDSYGAYDYYGHSLVVNPYGEVLKEVNGSETAFIIDIDLNDVRDIRNKLPILKNRVKF